MKKDRINDKPSKSKSPLNQTANPSRRNPTPRRGKPSAPLSLFLYSLGHQRPPTNLPDLSGHPSYRKPVPQTWRILGTHTPCSPAANPGHQRPSADLPDLSGHLVRWSRYKAPPVGS